MNTVFPGSRGYFPGLILIFIFSATASGILAPSGLSAQQAATPSPSILPAKSMDPGRAPSPASSATPGALPSEPADPSPTPEIPADEAAYPFAVSASTLASRQAMRPSRLSLKISFAPDTLFDPAQKDLLVMSIKSVLSPRPDEAWLLLENPDDAAKSGSDTGSDLACAIMIEGSMQAIQATAILTKTGQAAPVGKAVASGKVDPYFRNAFAGLWKGIRQLLTGEVKPVEEFARILVKGQPGTRVIIKDEVDFRLGPEGGTFTTVRVPSSVDIRSRSGHAEDTHQVVYLEKTGVVDLAQTDASPVAGEVWLHWLAYPGIGAAFPLADWFEASIHAELWDLSLLPASQGSEASRSVIAPRIDLGVETRFWLMPPTDDFRLGLSLGADLNFKTQDVFELDSLIPGSFHVGIPLSLALGNGFSLTFDLMPTFTVTTDAAMVLYARSVLEDSGYNSTSTIMDLHAMLGNIIFEPLHFRLGLRIQP